MDDMKSSDLDRSTVETAYARWEPIYDAVCGPVMVKGRRAAAAAARAIGGKILGVGGGTGLSFDDYDASNGARSRRSAATRWPGSSARFRRARTGGITLSR